MNFEVIIKPLETELSLFEEFTGSVIPLDNIKQSFNVLSAQVFTTYTLSLVKKLGSSAKIWINTLTEPAITGAIQTGGLPWEANTDFDLIIEHEGIRTIYFFVKR